MASNKLELIRSACETIENSEKVLAIAYQNQKKFAKRNQEGEGDAQLDYIVKQSKAVWWDLLIKDLAETIHNKCKEVVKVYEDTDGSLKNEHNALYGQASFQGKQTIVEV